MKFQVVAFSKSGVYTDTFDADTAEQAKRIARLKLRDRNFNVRKIVAHAVTEE